MSSPTQNRWHPPPVYHLRPLRGWMNDPCAPGYDATTGTYHLFYQWNPKNCDWGNITWGHYTSRDGLRWEHNGTEPVLRSSESYDQCGIYTGCFYPAGPKGEQDQLTVFYTSVCQLPIHWSLPYARNSEGLSMATSQDGGRTWSKSELNPILVGEPEGITVTGWRDPYVAEWPALDKVRGVQKSLYGVISGGIINEGPAIFIYSVRANDLSRWEYLGPLVLVAEGQYKPTAWTGNFGVNWECGNFMTLADNKGGFQFMFMGTEGSLRPDRSEKTEDGYGYWSTWMAGPLRQTADGPRMSLEMQGILDHGIFYAANSFEHPITKSRIVWGWLREDGLALERREAKCWAGFQSLPRELFLYRLCNVIGTLKTPLEDIASLKVERNSGAASKDVCTLGIRPLPGLESLRLGKPKSWENFANNTAPVTSLFKCKTASFELEAVIRLPAAGKQRTGFHLRHNEDLSCRLSIYFDPESELIVLDRSYTNQESDIKKDDLSGSFTLFRQLDAQGVGELERLHLRVFGDGDTIEIFANDRFALSAVAYLESTFTHISSFVEGPEEEPVVFERVHIWDEMASCLL